MFSKIRKCSTKAHLEPAYGKIDCRILAYLKMNDGSSGNGRYGGAK